METPKGEKSEGGALYMLLSGSPLDLHGCRRSNEGRKKKGNLFFNERKYGELGALHAGEEKKARNPRSSST